MTQLSLPGIGLIPDQPKEGTSAVVVFSGGQDSTTCLGYALRCFEKVYAICFLYRQKHEVEVGQAEHICKRLNVPIKIVSIPALGQVVESALIGESSGDVNAASKANSALPASYVPNRNALFLTIAHAYAQTLHAQAVITGVCETDYSGYPDCRAVFIREMEKALNIGYLTDIRILTPLMRLTKAQTFHLAKECGVLPIVLADSHTCYNGDHETWHDWGYGCGECAACLLREKGWENYTKEYQNG